MVAGLGLGDLALLAQSADGRLIAADLTQPSLTASVDATVTRLGPAHLDRARKTKQGQRRPHAIELRLGGLGRDRRVGGVERSQDCLAGSLRFHETRARVVEPPGDQVDRHLTRNFARVRSPDTIADEQERLPASRRQIHA